MVDEELWCSRIDLLLWRDWSRAMIRDLLGEPDRITVRRYRDRRVETHYWTLSRVHEAEFGAGFDERMDARERRGEAGRKAAATRVARLAVAAEEVVEWARNVSVRFGDDRPLDMVRRKARNNWRASREAFAEIRGQSFDGSLPGEEHDDRLAVNYLRHARSNYDDLVAAVEGRPGASEALLVIAERVLDAIAERYPELADECDRQYYRRLVAVASADAFRV